MFCFYIDSLESNGCKILFRRSCAEYQADERLNKIAVDGIDRTHLKTDKTMRYNTRSKTRNGLQRQPPTVAQDETTTVVATATAVETIRRYNTRTIPLEKLKTVVQDEQANVATDGNKTRGHSDNRSIREQTAQEPKDKGRKRTIESIVLRSVKQVTSILRTTESKKNPRGKGLHVAFEKGLKPAAQEEDSDITSLGGRYKELQAIEGQEGFEIVSREQAEDLEKVEDYAEMLENSKTVLEDSEGFSALDDSAEDRFDDSGLVELEEDLVVDAADSVTLRLEALGDKLNVKINSATLVIELKDVGADPRLHLGYKLRGFKSYVHFVQRVMAGPYPIDVTFSKPAHPLDSEEGLESVTLQLKNFGDKLNIKINSSTLAIESKDIGADDRLQLGSTLIGFESYPQFVSRVQAGPYPIDVTFSKPIRPLDEASYLDSSFQLHPEDKTGIHGMSTEDLLRALDPVLTQEARRAKNEHQDLVDGEPPDEQQQRNRTSVYTGSELNMVPSLMNDSGQQLVEDRIRTREEARNLKLHSRPRLFSQVKGSRTFRSAKMLNASLWKFFGMTTPDEEVDGRSTARWPRFIAAIVYIDQIIDAPASGKWPTASLCRAPKERIVVGCFNESVASIFKESLGRAVVANWESNDVDEITFAYSSHDLTQMWRQTVPMTRHYSSPTVVSSHRDLDQTPACWGNLKDTP
jgi:hypothetical protein